MIIYLIPFCCTNIYLSHHQRYGCTYRPASAGVRDVNVVAAIVIDIIITIIDVTRPGIMMYYHGCMITISVVAMVINMLNLSSVVAAMMMVIIAGIPVAVPTTVIAVPIFVVVLILIVVL